MDSGGFNWTWLALVGGLVLAAVIAWAMLRNRAPPPPRVEDSEEATRRLYEAEDREHRGESDNVP